MSAWRWTNTAWNNDERLRDLVLRRGERGRDGSTCAARSQGKSYRWDGLARPRPGWIKFTSTCAEIPSLAAAPPSSSMVAIPSRPQRCSLRKPDSARMIVSAAQAGGTCCRSGSSRNPRTDELGARTSPPSTHRTSGLCAPRSGVMLKVERPGHVANHRAVAQMTRGNEKEARHWSPSGRCAPWEGPGRCRW
jgi:hypothetical protein